MKPKLILMSHGNLAREVYESAKFITGDMEGVSVVCMSMDDGLEGTRAKLGKALEGPPASAIIIADIPGGTPCNAAVEKLIQNDNIRVLSGLNLGMVIEYALSSDGDMDEICESVLDAGLGSVQIIRKPKGEMADNGYED